MRNNQTVLLIRPVKGNAEGDMITVRVGQLPGKIRTIDAPADGCTVASLLNTAELNATGHEIRVDNQLATLDTPVSNNQTVLLIRPVKGNAEGDMITVRVGQLPGKIRTIDAPRRRLHRGQPAQHRRARRHRSRNPRRQPARHPRHAGAQQPDGAADPSGQGQLRASSEANAASVSD